MSVQFMKPRTNTSLFFECAWHGRSLRREGSTIEDGEWLRRATFVRVGALVVSTALLYVLYQRIR